MIRMYASQNCLNLIKLSESFSATPYLCPAKKLTIGFGHLILPGEIFTLITEQEAEELLRKDVAIFESCINNAVKVPISQNQFDALVSFAFNIGCQKFLESTLLKELNNAR